jgi:hypothetical protein
MREAKMMLSNLLKALTIFSLVVLTTMIIAVEIQAAASSSYDLSWWTVDGGGGSLDSGSDYSIDGSIGQFDASTGLHESKYGLIGGFWSGVMATLKLYFPILFR